MTGTVLPAPVRNAEVPAKVWDAVRDRRLLDCGDHVEFHDAGLVRK